MTAPRRARANQAIPDPIDIHVGGRIKAARRAAGLTQEQLAEHLGVTFQQVQKYERGANRVSASMLYRMGERLGIEPGFVYEGLPKPWAGAERPDPLEVFALAMGALPLADIFPRLSIQRQAALLAVARALIEEQRAALTGRSGGCGMVGVQVRTAECQSLPPPAARLLNRSSR